MKPANREQALTALDKLAAAMVQMNDALLDLRMALMREGIEPPPSTAILLQPAELLNTTARVRNKLMLEGIGTIGEVIRRNRHFYIRLHNFGKGSLASLEAALAEIGLKLPSLDRSANSSRQS